MKGKRISKIVVVLLALMMVLPLFTFAVSASTVKAYDDYENGMPVRSPLEQYQYYQQSMKYLTQEVVSKEIKEFSFIFILR